MLDLRVEFLHSATAHFPIAISFLCLMAKALEITCSKLSLEFSKQMELICRYLLFVLPLFTMITIFIGDEALEAVKNTACELVKIAQHGEQGERALMVLILCVLLQAGVLYYKERKLITNSLNTALLLCLCLNAWLMSETAHHGGELIFDHGVGVKVAQQDCALR